MGQVMNRQRRVTSARLPALGPHSDCVCIHGSARFASLIGPEMGETIASGIRVRLHSQSALEDPALFAGQRESVADIVSMQSIS